MPRRSKTERTAQARAKHEPVHDGSPWADTPTLPLGESPIDLSLSIGSAVGSKEPVSERQSLWLSFRSQSHSDAEATFRFNQWMINPEQHVTDAEVISWWRTDSFSNLATGVIHVGDPSVSFMRLAEGLAPAAYRALWSLLNSSNANAQGKGLELFMKLHGLLIDRVKTDAPDTIQKLTEMLREVKNVGVVEVYRAAQTEQRAVDGHYRMLGDGGRGDGDESTTDHRDS